MPPKTTPSPDILDERLTTLSSMVQAGFEDLKKLICAVDERVRALETSAMADLAVLKARHEAQTEMIGEHEKRLNELPKTEDIQKAVDDAPRNRLIASIALWIMGAFGLLVIALLWAIFTHEITIGG